MSLATPFFLALTLTFTSVSAISDHVISTNSLQANGFLFLHLHPPVIRVRPGETATGRINITVHESADVDTTGSPWTIRVRACCTQPEVAELIEAPEVAVRLEHIRSTVFSFVVVVRGVRMGRTTIRFFLTKNLSSGPVDERGGGAGGGGGVDLLSTYSVDPVLSLQSGGGVARSDEERGLVEGKPETVAVLLPPETEMKRSFAEDGSGGQTVQGRDSGRVSKDLAASNLFGNESIQSSPRFVFLNLTAVRVDEDGVKYRSRSLSADGGATPDLERLVGKKESFFSEPSGGMGGRGPVYFPIITGGSDMDNSSVEPPLHPGASFPVPSLHNVSEASVEVWWIPQEYHVIVCRRVERSEVVWVNYLLVALTCVNLVGIGGQLDWTEVIVLLRRPSTLALGLFARFAILPLFGLTVVELLHPADVVVLGSLVVLCSPTEGVASLLVLLVDGDITLSVLLTTVNNLAAFGVLPLWGVLFERLLYSDARRPPLQMPLRPMFLLLLLSTASIAVGHLLHRRFPRTFFKFFLLLPSISLLTVFAILLFELYSLYHLLDLLHPNDLLLIVALVLAGYSSGAVVAYLGRRSPGPALVVSMETGVRTTHVVVGHVLMTSLPEPDGDAAHAPATLYAVLCLLPAVAMATVYRIVYKYRLSVYAETECCKMMEEGGMLAEDLEELCPRSTTSASSASAAVAASTGDAAPSSPCVTTTAM